MSQHEQEVDPEIFKCKPSHGQGTQSDLDMGYGALPPRRKNSLGDQTPILVPELLITVLLPMQPVVHDPNMPNLIGDNNNNKLMANIFLLWHIFRQAQ